MLVYLAICEDWIIYPIVGKGKKVEHMKGSKREIANKILNLIKWVLELLHQEI